MQLSKSHFNEVIVFWCVSCCALNLWVHLPAWTVQFLHQLLVLSIIVHADDLHFFGIVLPVFELGASWFHHAILGFVEATAFVSCLFIHNETPIWSSWLILLLQLGADQLRWAQVDSSIDFFALLLWSFTVGCILLFSLGCGTTFAHTK